MPQSNLVETLQDLVRRHGFTSVLHSLAEIQSSSDSRVVSSSPKRARKVSKNKRSAVDVTGAPTSRSQQSNRIPTIPEKSLSRRSNAPER